MILMAAVLTNLGCRKYTAPIASSQVEHVDRPSRCAPDASDAAPPQREPLRGQSWSRVGEKAASASIITSITASMGGPWHNAKNFFSHKYHKVEGSLSNSRGTSVQTLWQSLNVVVLHAILLETGDKTDWQCALCPCFAHHLHLLAMRIIRTHDLDRVPVQGSSRCCQYNVSAVSEFVNYVCTSVRVSSFGTLRPHMMTCWHAMDWASKVPPIARCHWIWMACIYPNLRMKQCDQACWAYFPCRLGWVDEKDESWSCIKDTSVNLYHKKDCECSFSGENSLMSFNRLASRGNHFDFLIQHSLCNTQELTVGDSLNVNNIRIASEWLGGHLLIFCLSSLS